MSRSVIRQKTIIALVIACAIVSVLLAGLAVKPALQGIGEMKPGYILPLMKYTISLDDELTSDPSTTVDNRSFLTWLFNPMQGSMLIFFVIFMAGILVGAGLVYLEYHDFKISFEQLGNILVFLLPLVAVGAIVGTLALHKYNYFLLSIYIDIPLIVAPILYIVYKKFIAPKTGRGNL